MRKDEILKQISPEFKSWTNSRIGLSRYPQKIKKELIELLDRYTVSELEEALGVNSRSLYRWKRTSEGPTDAFGCLDHTSKEIRFIEIENPASSGQLMTLKFQADDGKSMTLSNVTSIREIEELIRIFLQEENN